MADGSIAVKTWMTRKIAGIECNNARNVVDIDGRHQAGVMDLLARHAVLCDKPFPLGLNVGVFSENHEKAPLRAIWATAHAQLMPSPLASAGVRLTGTVKAIVAPLFVSYLGLHISPDMRHLFDRRPCFPAVPKLCPNSIRSGHRVAL